MTDSNGHDLNLPYLPNPDPYVVEEEMQLSGGVVVLGAFLPLPQAKKHPGVMFRFAKPDGSGFYLPVLLAPDRQADLRALPALVEQAVTNAIAHATS